MAQLKITLRGSERVQARISELKAKSQETAKQIIYEHTLAISADAKNRCAVKTGRTRASIRARFSADGFSSSVSSNERSSVFLEFGTGVRGETSSHPPLPQEYAYGGKAGMPAQPFMFPAAEADRPQFERDIRKIIKI